jgi:5-methylcytosine-specific restriction endonuclease McrA
MGLRWFKLNLWQDQRVCSYCGKKLTFREATVDHIIPQDSGGQTCYSNLTLACQRCNCLKGNLPLDEFERVLIRRRIIPP